MAVVPIPGLLPHATSLAERLQLIDGLMRVLEGAYAHLPLKRARYGFDPIQRLRILHAEAHQLGEDAFQHTLADIVTCLRDSHTRYTERSALAGKVAVLPFLVEMIGSVAEPRYLVTKVGPGLDPEFVPGVVIEYWNAVPMDLAVQRRGEWEFGGRPDSRRALATQSMTMRPLQYGPPPDEHWVIIGYRAMGEDGIPADPMREIRIHWQIVDPGQAVPSGETDRSAGVSDTDAHLAKAVDPAAAVVRQAKMLMFAPGALVGRQARAWPPAVATSRRQPPEAEVIPTQLTQAMKVMCIQAPGGPFGYLRVYGFEADAALFIPELLRVIPLIPDRGLIIDIRGNPGGYIRTAELSLQLFTPRSVLPTRFSLLATPLMRDIVGLPPLRDVLAPWRPSLEAAVRNGELYSQAIPITSPADCNAIGQQYGGPVVLVADATTYSAGDLFSAGFVDNDIGPFLCVGEATGGGGANVWEYARLQETLVGLPAALPVFPEGIALSFSFRRATRSGPNEGMPIEDVGISGVSYGLTRDDLLVGNLDLLERCFELLRAQRLTRLVVEVELARRILRATTSGLDRLDVLFDGHPGCSHQIDAREVVSIEYPLATSLIELIGFAGEQVCQRRRMTVPRPADVSAG